MMEDMELLHEAVEAKKDLERMQKEGFPEPVKEEENAAEDAAGKADNKEEDNKEEQKERKVEDL